MSAVPVEAIPRPASPGDPDGRPDSRHGQGQGRDPRPRRQALPRAGRHRSFSPQPVPPARPDANRSFVFVPKSAVFQENGHDHVWVVGTNNVVRKRPVEVATTTDALARVESGLEAGESVVLNPSQDSARERNRPDRRMTAANRRKRKVLRPWPICPRSSCAASTRNTAATSS